MTRRNDSMATAVQIAIRENLKRVNTAMPGKIVEYDADTRRASVRGSLRLLTRDRRVLRRPVINNVPVLFPEAGGYSIRFPLSEGDNVLLIFNQRGLDHWKVAHLESSPGLGPILAERDAVALAGFGAAGNSPPAVEDALVLSGPNGYLAVTEDVVETDMEVTIKADTEVETLPVASEEYEGRLRHLRTGTGTQLWFCRKNGATTWEWVELTG